MTCNLKNTFSMRELPIFFIYTTRKKNTTRKNKKNTRNLHKKTQPHFLFFFRHGPRRPRTRIGPVCTTKTAPAKNTRRPRKKTRICFVRMQTNSYPNTHPPREKDNPVPLPGPVRRGPSATNIFFHTHSLHISRTLQERRQCLRRLVLGRHGFVFTTMQTDNS